MHHRAQARPCHRKLREIRVRGERVPQGETRGYFSDHSGKTLPFVVERKVNEIELGYVIYDSKDIIIELLTRGLAKLRGEKINSDHIDDYKDAEVEAQMAERGIWSEESKPEGAYRYLKKTWTDKEFF